MYIQITYIYKKAIDDWKITKKRKKDLGSDTVAKDYARSFYKSTAWKKCRRSFIGGRRSIDGGLCQHCISRQGYIVDHIIEINPENINNAEITLNHDNLQYLCLECHNTKTFKKHFATRADVMFDDQGNLIEAYPPCF